MPSRGSALPVWILTDRMSGCERRPRPQSAVMQQQSPARSSLCPRPMPLRCPLVQEKLGSIGERRQMEKISIRAASI